MQKFWVIDRASHIQPWLIYFISKCASTMKNNFLAGVQTQWQENYIKWKWRKKRWLEKQKNSSKLQRQRERKTESERVFVGMQYCSRKQVETDMGCMNQTSYALPFSPSAGVREQKKSTQRKRKREQFNDEVPIITFSIQRLKLAHIHTHTHTHTNCGVKQWGVYCSAGTQRLHDLLCVIKHCRKVRKSSSQQISSKI